MQADVVVILGMRHERSKSKAITCRLAWTRASAPCCIKTFTRLSSPWAAAFSMSSVAELESIAAVASEQHMFYSIPRVLRIHGCRAPHRLILPDTLHLMYLSPKASSAWAHTPLRAVLPLVTCICETGTRFLSNPGTGWLLSFSENGSYYLGMHSFLTSSRKTKTPDARTEPREEAVQSFP